MNIAHLHPFNFPGNPRHNPASTQWEIGKLFKLKSLQFFQENPHLFSIDVFINNLIPATSELPDLDLGLVGIAIHPQHHEPVDRMIEKKDQSCLNHPLLSLLDPAF